MMQMVDFADLYRRKFAANNGGQMPAEAPAVH